MLQKHLVTALALLVGALLLAGCGGASLRGIGGTAAGDAVGVADDAQPVLKPQSGDKGAASGFTDPTPDDKLCWDLIAGQNMYAGEVCVWNDGDYLYVEYNMEDGFPISEAHVYVGTDKPDGKGNPGKFQYKEEFDPPVYYKLFELELDWAPKSTLYIATHAASGNETLWGGRWNDGDPTYEYTWNKKWGGYFSIHLAPVFDPANEKAYKAFHYGVESYWNIQFQTQDWYPFPGSNNWVGWCTDPQAMYPNLWYYVDVYSSYDPNLPAYAQSDNWEFISYMINMRNKGEAPFDEDWSDNYWKEVFQNAVWYFKHGTTNFTPLYSESWDLINNAIDNGDNYVPGAGEYYAVILYPKYAADPYNVYPYINYYAQYETAFQMNIIEVDP